MMTGSGIMGQCDSDHEWLPVDKQCALVLMENNIHPRKTVQGGCSLLRLAKAPTNNKKHKKKHVNVLQQSAFQAPQFDFNNEFFLKCASNTWTTKAPLRL